LHLAEDELSVAPGAAASTEAACLPSEPVTPVAKPNGPIEPNEVPDFQVDDRIERNAAKLLSNIKPFL